jgi:uncharacterized protein
MMIEISKVSEQGSTCRGEEGAEILQIENDRHIRVNGPISYDFFVQVVSHELIVQGTLRLPVALQCARCADFYSTILADSSFLRAYKFTEGQKSVDLTADIRESILLEVPPVSYCSPDCRGLCPYCGINLNQGACQCRPPQPGGDWTVLDRLKL